MTQTLALLLDAYRELSAKKLFWMVLMLSGLVVGVFAMLGITPEGVQLAVWNIGDFGGFVNSDNLPPAMFYKAMFSGLGIKFWLTWIASILALISTASLIPDFIAGGAIELSLSKPLSRLRLFLTKYFSGLLFVALQVTIFSAASFLVIGLRGGEWLPGVFLAIPVVVIFFSYLYSFCALVGLITRSTIAALLLTLLFWVFLFCLNITDQTLIQGRELNAMRSEAIAKQIERMEKSAEDQLRRDLVTEKVSMGEPREQAEAEAREATFTSEQRDQTNPKIGQARQDLSDTRDNAPAWATAAKAARIAKTFFPKTTETTDLLERVLVEDMDLDTAEEEPDNNAPSWMRLSRADQQRLAQRIQAELRRRSVWWILGTSLGFEALVLGFASWVFVRRDF